MTDMTIIDETEELEIIIIIIINVFYFNCPFADPIGSNLNKQ
jgi:hypothetical protein